MRELSDDAVDQHVRDAIGNDSRDADDVPTDVDDGLLVAHRAGRLPPDQAAHVDAQLDASPATRALHDALADEPRLDQLRQAERAASKKKRPNWVPYAAAAAVLLAAGIPTYLELTREPPPPMVAYELVEIRGNIKTTRGAEDEPAEDDIPVFDENSIIEIRLAPARPTQPSPVRVLTTTAEHTARDSTTHWKIQSYGGGGLSLRAVINDLFRIDGQPFLAEITVMSDASEQPLLIQSIKLVESPHSD